MEIIQNKSPPKRPHLRKRATAIKLECWTQNYISGQLKVGNKALYKTLLPDPNLTKTTN